MVPCVAACPSVEQEPLSLFELQMLAEWLMRDPSLGRYPGLLQRARVACWPAICAAEDLMLREPHLSHAAALARCREMVAMPIVAVES